MSLLLAGLSLGACQPPQPHFCIVKATGEVMPAKSFSHIGGGLSHFEVKDANGLIGRVDASNSKNFICKRASL